MKSKRVFFRYFAFALEIILLWVLQSTPKLMPEVFGSKPLLLLASALSFSVFEEPAPAIILGAVCGALCDLSSGGTVGWFAVAMTLVCFAQAGLLGTYLNRNFITSSLLSLGSVAAVTGLYFVFFRLFAGVADCGQLFVEHYLSRIVYTYLCFFPLYLLNGFLHRRLGEGRR